MQKVSAFYLEKQKKVLFLKKYNSDQSLQICQESLLTVPTDGALLYQFSEKVLTCIIKIQTASHHQKVIHNVVVSTFNFHISKDFNLQPN